MINKLVYSWAAHPNTKLTSKSKPKNNTEKFTNYATASVLKYLLCEVFQLNDKISIHSLTQFNKFNLTLSRFQKEFTSIKIEPSIIQLITRFDSVIIGYMRWNWILYHWWDFIFIIVVCKSDSIIVLERICRFN